MAKKLPDQLAYVKVVHARGRRYEYFDTGSFDIAGKRLYKRLPARGDRGFGGTYAAFLAARTARQRLEPDRTVSALSRAYQRDGKFTHRSDATQTTYLIYLRLIEDQMGPAPIRQVERRDVRAILDKLADRAGAANMVLVVLRNLFKFAMSKDWIASDPTAGIEMMEGGEGEYEPWPEPLLEAALADDDLRLPVALLYYTAQRIGDVCRMRWSDVRDGFIFVKQQKTGKELDIRLHDDLAAILSTTPKTSLTILHGPRGGPLKHGTLRERLQRFGADHGHHIVPHGLRKNAVIALLEAGCTAVETAAISGQSMRMVEHYAKRRNNRKLGSAAILKWQGTKRENRKQLENG